MSPMPVAAPHWEELVLGTAQWADHGLVIESGQFL